MSHAKLSASGSATWLNCPAAPRICEGLPDDTSPYAEEGTKAHAQAEAMLRGEEGPFPEMAADVQPYVDYVNSLPGDRWFEQRLDYTEWVPEGFGTADAVVIDGDLLTIIDLKFGMGVRVYAQDNSQMRIYAIAALQRWQWDYGISRIKMTICQPRLDHVSEDTLGIGEILDWGNEVKRKAALTLDPAAPAVPGEKQCRWCKARTVCRPRAIDALTVAGSDHLTPADVGALLRHVDGIKSWLSDLEAHAFDLLNSGADVPGYKLVEGRSLRALTDNAVDTLRAAGLDDSAIYRQSYRTLGDIEKSLGGKKKAAPVLEKCTTKPAGKPTIAPTSDPRPTMSASVAFEIGD